MVEEIPLRNYQGDEREALLGNRVDNQRDELNEDQDSNLSIPANQFDFGQLRV